MIGPPLVLAELERSLVVVQRIAGFELTEEVASGRVEGPFCRLVAAGEEFIFGHVGSLLAPIRKREIVVGLTMRFELLRPRQDFGSLLPERENQICGGGKSPGEIPIDARPVTIEAAKIPQPVGNDRVRGRL